VFYLTNNCSLYI